MVDAAMQVKMDIEQFCPFLSFFSSILKIAHTIGTLYIVFYISIKVAV